MFNTILNLFKPKAPKPPEKDQHYDAFGDFEPYYDDTIYETIETAEEHEKIKQIKKMNLRQLAAFGEEHTFDWRIGRYKNNVHTSNVIAKTVSVCVRNAQKRGEVLVTWDSIFDAVDYWRMHNAYDNVADINRKLK